MQADSGLERAFRKVRLLLEGDERTPGLTRQDLERMVGYPERGQGPLSYTLPPQEGLEGVRAVRFFYYPKDPEVTLIIEVEDQQGRPFVGAAGQLLDRILAACGITREEVYIANIVKCRPPGNRTPLREEAEACLPHLRRQIELIKPRIIVLLGSTALQYLVGSEARITKTRGQWLGHLFGARVMPTYHPAALLRDPGKKRSVWEDFQRIRDAYFSLKNA